jgi:hypothetical protein
MLLLVEKFGDRQLLSSARALLAGAIASLPAFVSAAEPPPQDVEWPRYGHDGALTGRTALKGDIAIPRLAWTVSLAGAGIDLEVRPAEGSHPLALPGEVRSPARTVAVPAQPSLDVDGSGALRPAAESHHARWADILPAVKGLERVAWDQTWTTEKVCHLELFAHDEGADHPRKVWRTEAEDIVFSPLDVVWDLDGDGVQEICVALHYRVMIYEGTTGRKESEIRFHGSRSYGWFGLGDVDGDGRMELVVLSDFQSHFDVLDYDPAKPEAERLSVLWRRDVEPDIDRRAKWPQVGPHPLADVSGDGKPEIVLNLFNDTGDGEWHAVVIEGATGKVIHDLPRRYVQGSADLDGDGAEEIFLAASDGVFVPSRGTIEAAGFRDGRSRVLWSRSRAGFALADLPGPGRLWATTAAEGMRRVIATEGKERPAFLAFEDGAAPGSASTLLALGHDGRGISETWRVEGLAGEIEALAVAGGNAGPSALIRIGLPAGLAFGIEGRGAAPVPVARSALGTPPFPPAAARLERGGPVLVIAEGAGRSIFAIRSGRGAPEIAWRRPGRGMADGGWLAGIAAADLDGDGGAEVVAADRTPSGAASLVAYRGNGDVLWRSDFPRVPGANPVWNIGALTFWWPGRFRDPGRIDILASTRRGPMHSDVGRLIDGRTGREAWSREKAAVPGEFSWGYAGSAIAAGDLLGDAREEIANLYPVCFWIADGSSGEILAARELASRKLLPAWAAYGEPILLDADGDGRREVLLDSVYVLALLDREGKPIWHGKGRKDYLSGKPEDNVGETTATKHALLDLDGDGRLEVASAGYGDGARAIDLRDGKILWSLAEAAPTGRKCAAADIDGDGGDDLLYAAGDSLIAISGNRERGRILWKWKGPAALSMPAFADVDGDGKAEVIVASADGGVHCLDGPARP